MWDQEGGFKCDQHGILTKEWRWLTGVTQMEKIVLQVRPEAYFTAHLRSSSRLVQLPHSMKSTGPPCPPWPLLGSTGAPNFSPSSLYKHVYLLQVSDQISVMLRSGTSATLMFRWNKSRADVLLPVVATRYQPEARVGGKSGRRC